METTTKEQYDTELEHLYQAIDEGKQREAIATKILTEKRNEAAELTKQVQELKEELSRCKDQFEHLAEVANKITTGNLSHHRTTIMCIASSNAEFIDKRFIQKT